MYLRRVRASTAEWILRHTDLCPWRSDSHVVMGELLAGSARNASARVTRVTVRAHHDNAHYGSQL